MVIVELLGALGVRVDGRPAVLRGPMQAAVLARLVAAGGEVVSADRLIDDLWAGAPPPKAAGSLQAHISHLRRALEPERPARSPARVVVSRAPGYALQLPAAAVDVWHFERLFADAAGHTDPDARHRLLDTALALWRGPAYAACADAAWAAAEITRVTDMRWTAMEQRAQAALDLGRPGDVAATLPRLLHEQPGREEAVRLLALAHYRLGRQLEALAVLRRARTTLHTDFGIDPGPPLRALESAILAHDPSLLPQSAPRMPAGPARGTADPAAPPTIRGASSLPGLEPVLDPVVARPEPHPATPLGAPAPPGPATAQSPVPGQLSIPVLPEQGAATTPGRAVQPGSEYSTPQARDLRIPHAIEAPSAESTSVTAAESPGPPGTFSETIDPPNRSASPSTSSNSRAGSADSTASIGDRPRVHPGAMVGYAAQRAVLHAAAREAARGGARLVWIEGEAGAGKSTLVGSVIGDLSESGWRVAVGSCPEVDGAPAGWAWQQIHDELSYVAAELESTRPTLVTAVWARGEAIGLSYPAPEVAGETSDPAVEQAAVPERGVPSVASDAGVGRPTSSGEPERTRADRNIAGAVRDSGSRSLGGGIDSNRGAAGDTAFGLARTVAGRCAWWGRRQPVVVVVEDVHRADGATLQMLRQVVAWTAGTPVLFAVTVRGSEVRDEIRATSAALAAVTVGRCELGGLDAGSVRAVAEGAGLTGMDEDTVRLVCARTGGNPLFVVELAKLAAAEGDLLGVPPGVRDVLHRRIARLPDAAARMLRLLAVWGEAAEFGVLPLLLDENEDALVDLVDTVVAAGLLRTEGRRIRFGHALIRDAVYSGIPALRRARMHGDALRVAARAAAPDVHALAHHALAGGDAVRPEAALGHVVTAARHSAARRAFAEAAPLWQAALELHALAGHPEDGSDRAAGIAILEARCELVGALAHGGNDAAARSLRHRALTLAEFLDESPSRTTESVLDLPDTTVGASRGDRPDAHAVARARLGRSERSFGPRLSGEPRKPSESAGDPSAPSEPAGPSEPSLSGVPRVETARGSSDPCRSPSPADWEPVSPVLGGTTPPIIAAHLDRIRERADATHLAPDPARDPLACALGSWRAPVIWETRDKRLPDARMIDALRTALARDLTPGDRVRLLTALVFEVEGDDDPLARAAAAEAVLTARALGDAESLCAAINARAFLALGPELWDERESLTAELLAVSTAAGLVEFQAVAHFLACLIACGSNDLLRARAEVERGLECATGGQLNQMLTVLSLFSAVLAVLHGDLDTAERVYAERSAEMIASGTANGPELLLVSGMMLGWARGDLSALAEPLARVYEVAPHAMVYPYVAALLDAGDADRARTVFDAAAPVKRDHYWSVMASFRARAALGLGDGAAIAECYRDMLPRAGTMAGLDTGSVVYGPVDAMLAELATALGDSSAAASHRTRAADVAAAVAAQLALMPPPGR
ncbi:BTAD domain-containing putative transcriptional regulator [Nocardia sp. NPDC003693]